MNMNMYVERRAMISWQPKQAERIALMPEHKKQDNPAMYTALR